MSLSERLKSRRTPEPLPGLSRSRSFAGLLGGNQHRRTASATANFASLGSGGGSDAGSVSSLGSSGSGELHHHHRTCNGSTGGGSSSGASTLSRATNILGQSHSPNTTRRLLQGFSATWGGKPPPAPRPQRAVTIFQAIEKGLKECIRLTQKDISNLKSSVESLSVNSSQQLKTAERYLKRLEYQAAKLEELAEQYDVQQRMRDGVRTMAYAYVLNPGKERDSALHSVRSGYKECTDILCGIETELERMMGTLMFQLKGIQGFARLCAGDIFEITVKHGEQKWKTKGRILKNEKQVWDNPRAIFKALMGEMLYIKAVEVRTLSKNILLGHKYCETKDLFSAHPQMMTVNLNPSGSLKLHVVITWNPLHGCPEELSPKPIPPLLAALQSPMMKRRAPLPPTSTVAVHEDLHSPSSNGSLPNGRSMVCMPPLVPSSPSSMTSSPQLVTPPPPTLLLDSFNEDQFSASLDFAQECESRSSSDSISDLNLSQNMERCSVTKKPLIKGQNEFSVSYFDEEDLRNCMQKKCMFPGDQADYLQENKNFGPNEYGNGEGLNDLHVIFDGVHDSQSLYGSKGGYQSSGYESQSRNSSTLRSVRFNFEPSYSHGSLNSSNYKGSFRSPTKQNFRQNSQNSYQAQKSIRTVDNSYDSSSDSCIRNSYETKSKYSENGKRDIRLAPSCAVINLQPYAVDQKLGNILGGNTAQHRLGAYLEYR